MRVAELLGEDDKLGSALGDKLPDGVCVCELESVAVADVLAVPVALLEDAPDTVLTAVLDVEDDCSSACISQQ